LASWAAKLNTPEERREAWERKRVLVFLKWLQTIEFKQAKAMHQHECNNKFQ
jgi:hypothetical protein